MKVDIMPPARRVPASARTLKYTPPVAVNPLDRFGIARFADQTDGADNETRVFMPTLPCPDVFNVDVVPMRRVVPCCTENTSLEYGVMVESISGREVAPIGE